MRQRCADMNNGRPFRPFDCPCQGAGLVRFTGFHASDNFVAHKVQANHLRCVAVVEMAAHGITHLLVQLLDRFSLGEDRFAQGTCRVTSFGGRLDNKDDFTHGLDDWRGLKEHGSSGSRRWCGTLFPTEADRAVEALLSARRRRPRLPSGLECHPDHDQDRVVLLVAAGDRRHDGSRLHRFGRCGPVTRPTGPDPRATDPMPQRRSSLPGRPAPR